jgi:hypothetical protein
MLPFIVLTPSFLIANLLPSSLLPMPTSYLFTTNGAVITLSVLWFPARA